MTTTAADLKIAQRLYAGVCEDLGLIPEGMHLTFSTGSKLYGIAYRVALTGDRVTAADGTTSYPKGSGHGRPPLGSDFLGMTKAEAERALRERVDTVYSLIAADLLDLT